MIHAIALTLLLPPADDAPTRAEVADALHRAVAYFHGQVGVQGGYVWRTGADLNLREGEGEVGPTRVWVQPPGTPAVGMAFLDAYDATADPLALQAARAVGECLARGQLRSGGWDYWIEFDPALRGPIGYRDEPEPARRPTGRTTLDDNTTQAAIRFLVRLDRAVANDDPRITDARSYALDALHKAQYPNGGWYVWWRAFPGAADPAAFPVVPAGYPDDWRREWRDDYTGIYVTNDNLVRDAVDTLLAAHDATGDEAFLDSVRRAGDFLILAQMPEPQPAWAQQYDEAMHPVWARKFEPPAVSGGESQGILRTLLRIAEATGDARYLEPIPRAIAYLRQSTLPDGRLARFYELETDRPLYFTRDYRLTYSADDLPTHYGFQVDSQLDAIEREYQALRERSLEPAPAATDQAPAPAEVRALLDALSSQGAWAELGNMRGFNKATPPGGILSSATFIRNVGLLCRYLQSLPQP